MTLPTTPMNNGTGTRPLGRCLTYLRRSLDRQEHGIHSHFEWAQAKAAELGLVMRATKADLEAMLASGDPVRNDLYLDSGITGANLGRPGLLALRRDAIADSGVSHVLVHNLDRLARPEITAEAMTQDNGLLYAGITIVTASTIRLPRVRGVVYLVDDILALCAYTESGEFLNRLGERVVPAMRQVAEQGFRVGGTTPYGFGRVLIDATTGEKVMDLPKHMRVRQPGCRVSLEVADPEKIRIWLYMLDLYHRERLGFRRIARKLNDLGYPSPGAADTRRVRSNGSVGMASGRWTAETVRRLINNRVIAGITSWGQTSVGAHRRLGPSGAPRLLESADRDKLNRPKPVRNPQEVVVTAAVRGLQPPADPAILDKCRQIAKARREGRPSPTRSRDMGRYPLSGCVIDGCCGSTMWGQSKGRDGLRYLCSRYHKSVGSECHHNSVDAEALFAFTLGSLKQLVERVGGRAALEDRLRRLAEQSKAATSAADLAAAETEALEAKVRQLEADLGVAAENMTLARDPRQRQAMQGVFDRKSDELDDKRQRLAATRERARRSLPDEANGVDARVAAALKLYDQLEDLPAQLQPGSPVRVAVGLLMQQIGLQLTLQFGEQKKGTRLVRTLLGGRLSLGGPSLPPPCSPSGDDGDGPEDPAEPDEAEGHNQRSANLQSRDGVARADDKNGYNQQTRPASDQAVSSSLCTHGVPACGTRHS